MRRKIGTVITVSDGNETMYIGEGGTGTEYGLTPHLHLAKNFRATGKVLDAIRGQVVTQFPKTFTNIIERWAEQ